MKSDRRFIRCLALSFALTIPLLAQTKETPAADNAAAAAIQAEMTAISAARAAALRDDDTAVDADIATAPQRERAALPTSIVVLQRAAAVCGWLLNENDYGRARKLARRTLAQLESVKESDPADRAERLYWEAWIESDVLDNRVRGLKLLKEASILTPDDPRIKALAARLAAAVGRFGR